MARASLPAMAARPLCTKVKIDPQTIRLMGTVIRASIRGVMEIAKMHGRGEVSTRTLVMVAAAPTGGVILCCMAYGPDVVLGSIMGSDVIVIKDELTEEEKQKELDALEEARKDLQRVGEVKLLTGTAPPPTWTSDQAGPKPRREFEAVRIESGATRDALAACLRGNDIGRGGRDAVTGKPYSQLELVDAWRIENATLWGKFAAERMQVREWTAPRCLTST